MIKSTAAHSELVARLLNDLAEKQIAMSDCFFSTVLCEDLQKELDQAYQKGLFKPAAIGRRGTLQTQSQIRGDAIHWLDEDNPSSSAAARTFFAAMSDLKNELNRHFFLGLDHVEAHFAFYPPGTGYEKHVDQHPGTRERQITFILYLNSNWEEAHGGHLRIYDPLEPTKVSTRIAPRLGRLVLFRSEVFPHQVEESHQPRRSLTGWFRTRSLA